MTMKTMMMEIDDDQGDTQVHKTERGEKPFNIS